MRFKVVILLAVVIFLASCSAEKKALKIYERGRFQIAINRFEKILKNNPEDGTANYYVAESYRKSNRIKEAVPYYEKAKGPGINKDTVQFYHAQALKANGEYETARNHFKELSVSADIESIKERALVELNGLDMLEALEENGTFYRVKNLEQINSKASEYAPVFLNGELYFTSNRGDGKIYEATGTPFSDIYKVTTQGANVDMATLQALPEYINDPMKNEGCLTFTPDGQIMVFGKGNSTKKGEGADVDLYISRFRNGVWMKPMVAGGINTRYKDERDPTAKYFSFDSSPAFSPDGRTLYFSSNRRKGEGGTDLYKAQMDSRGRFRSVKNLGSVINTPGNEMFPYVSDDGRFFFASDGHPGYGGLDLFVLERENGKDVVKNLGKPMNSNADDFGVFLFKPDRGFFTSNREEGKGDDDIYTFIDENPDLKVVNYYLQGIVYHKEKDGKLIVIPNSEVALLDEEGMEMQTFSTGTDGKFLFRVYPEENYQLIGESDGYIKTREKYSTKGKSVNPKSLKDLVTNITLDTMIVLQRKATNVTFVLENIHFDFDSANIKKTAAEELDKLVQILVDNPGIRIEMGSHTDNKGSHDYNILLSQRRAQSTVDYLIQEGINSARLTAKGYGETIPVAPNQNPDGSDNPIGRAKNRRTEFKIISIEDVVKVDEDQVKPEEEYEEDKYFRD